MFPATLVLVNDLKSSILLVNDCTCWKLQADPLKLSIISGVGSTEHEDGDLDDPVRCLRQQSGDIGRVPPHDSHTFR